MIQIYDIYWAGNDERKIELISELQEMEKSLYTADESKQYAEEGANAYASIGQMYSSYLARESTKEREGR